MHYVVGDVHGCYDEFTALRKKIEKKDPDAVIILTGDLIDRGPKVWEMLRWAMKNITEDGKYQCICGNHEDMVISWYYDWATWYASENRKNYAKPKTSYGFDEVLKENGLDTPEKVLPIMEFFQSLPFRKEVRAEFPDGSEVLFDIVHGADSFEEGISEDYRRELNLWGREGSVVDERTIVIHGHTPTMCYDYLIMGDQPNRPGMIGYQKQDINLDGGCCFSDITNAPCFLCAICLETMEEIYPRMIWSQLMHHGKAPKTRKEAVAEAKEFLIKYPWKENIYRKEILEMLRINPNKGESAPEPEQNPEQNIENSLDKPETEEVE